MSVANRTVCPGYPPYPCTTLIDPAKPSGLCEFCMRTKAAADAEQARNAELVARVQRIDTRRTEFLDSLAKPEEPRTIYHAEANLPVQTRTVKIDRPVFGQPDTWHPITEVVEIIEAEIVPSCECGGMRDGPDHDKSLLHRQYLIANPPTLPDGTVRIRTHWPRGNYKP